MNAATDSVREIRALLEAAERATVAGAVAEAERALAQARALAPEHPMVLGAAGAHALRGGDAAGARALIERALAGDARNTSLWVNLASAQRALADADAELAALDQALALEPRHFLALLQKASLLETLGRHKKAATTYHAALLCMPPGSQLPAKLRPAIDHAVRAVRSNNLALESYIKDRVRDTRATVSADDAARFDACVDVLVGKKRVYVQQPTFLNFPYLPAIQFYARREFSWLGELEAACEDIRAEVLPLLQEDSAGLEPYVAHAPGTPLDQWAELNHSPRWSAYFLWRDGTAVAEHLERCPKTAAMLERMPCAHIAGHAPGAFFSVLQPKTRIPPHTGVTNTRLIVHLPLIVPQGCRFRVGSETREVRAGQAWVFDDTLEHEAWNDSGEPRVVLIFDVWNPYLSEKEKELLSLAIPSVNAYYDSESPLAKGS